MNLNDQFHLKTVVTEEIYQGFINLFKDKNSLHVDKDYANSKGFKDVIMHGNILHGFISYFIGECLPLKNVIIHSQEIKYYKPVFLNDILQFHAMVVDVVSSVNVFIFSFHFENQEKIKVAKGKIQIGVLY
jgi:3-hydroxybutyryl-CoA dehydratase